MTVIKNNVILLTLLSSLLLSWATITPADAALSASTVNTIQGSAPYLTFDGGVTRVSNMDSLLGITLSDGTIYSKLTNTSTALLPIELPVANQTFSDVKTLIPATLMTVDLSTLISSPYNRWGDDDGDGQGLGGVSVTGTLSVSLRDVNNKNVGLSDTLEGCKSPYRLTLSTTSGTLSTQYGSPNSSNFTASSTTYYIKPKFTVPYVCFAKPNLAYYEGQPEWDGTKGFKPQDVGTPSSNFPRTGFNGAFFDIRVEGVTAANVITATGSPITQGGVTATLTAQSTKVLRVMLTGPNNASGGGAFTPSTFIIKSSASNDIYSFALSKWYIPKSGAGGGYPATQTYCSGLSGSYRVPGIADYTNANGNGWTGGLSGWSNNNYARAIGGGLFAEWGYTYNGYYTTSDWENFRYWVGEPYSSIGQYGVYSNYGSILGASPSNTSNRAACVSP